MHTMKVQKKYYNLLKSGEKTIELRLFDEKRQAIKIGDAIIFSNLDDPNDTFKATVINLHRANNFDTLCDIITPAQAGFPSKTELLAVLEQFYAIPDQIKFGVVGIEIKRC